MKDESCERQTDDQVPVYFCPEGKHSISIRSVPDELPKNTAETWVVLLLYFSKKIWLALHLFENRSCVKTTFLPGIDRQLSCCLLNVIMWQTWPQDSFSLSVEVLLWAGSLATCIKICQKEFWGKTQWLSTEASSHFYWAKDLNSHCPHHFPWCVVGQDLSHNIILQHPWDY